MSRKLLQPEQKVVRTFWRDFASSPFPLSRPTLNYIVGSSLDTAEHWDSTKSFEEGSRRHFANPRRVEWPSSPSDPAPLAGHLGWHYWTPINQYRGPILFSGSQSFGGRLNFSERPEGWLLRDWGRLSFLILRYSWNKFSIFVWLCCSQRFQISDHTESPCWVDIDLNLLQRLSV